MARTTFSTSASVVLLVLAAPAAAHEGWGVVSVPGAGVYFTDVAREVVWRIDSGGGASVAVEDTHTHALVTIADGYVYGAHAGDAARSGHVWRIDSEGRVQTLVPPAPGLPFGFESLLVDTDGTVYSAGGVDPSTPVMLLRRRPDGGIEPVTDDVAVGISGMAWAPDGAILFTDGPFLRRLSLEGGLETLGGGPLTEMRRNRGLMGVTTNGSGGAFVADFARGRILNVGRYAGVDLEYAASFPWSPAGIARDAEGLLVLEHLVPPWGVLGDLQVGPYLRVRRLGVGGRVVTMTVLWGTRTWLAAIVLAGAAIVAIAAYIRRYRPRRI